MINSNVKREPFHKAIVSLIHTVASFDGSLDTIGLVLQGTTIPEGHDEIIKAWTTRCERTCPPPRGHEEVTEGLIAHKKEIEAEKNRKGNPLDRFQLADEKHA